MREIYVRFWSTSKLKDDSAVLFARDLVAVCPKPERCLISYKTMMPVIRIERGPGGDVEATERLLQVEEDGFQMDFAKRHW